MRNKNVGFLIAGISVVIGFIIYIFNRGAVEVLGASCSHGSSCSMYQALSLQTWISIAIAVVILLIGLFLIFAKEEEKVIIKKIKPYGEIKPKKFDRKSLEGLRGEEKKIMNLLLEKEGSLMQAEIAKVLEMNKVRVTRILDELEGKGFIERKRRGMSNIVLLKR